jgi:hypothetical protein
VHPWVAARKHVAEIGDRDARVERGGREPAMAEQCLDVMQIGAAAQQMRRAGVSQRVRDEPDADAMAVVPDTCAQACGTETGTIAREEERGVDSIRGRRGIIRARNHLPRGPSSDRRARRVSSSPRSIPTVEDDPARGGCPRVRPRPLDRGTDIPT